MVLQQNHDKAKKTGNPSKGSTVATQPVIKPAPKATKKTAVPIPAAATAIPPQILTEQKPIVLTDKLTVGSSIKTKHSADLSNDFTSTELAEQPTTLTASPNESSGAIVARTQGKSYKALLIIAEESGIDMSEMTNETVFADVGIDSLMSMVIGSRLREELDLDLDADFSIFADLPTVKSLKVFLDGTDISEPIETSAKEIFVTPVQEVAIPFEENITTGVMQNITPSAQLVTDEHDKKSHAALCIIAEESGIEISEMTDETVFADVGIDSLMSMVIGSRLREELDLDLDSDFSIFADLPTVKSLKIFLDGPDVVPAVKVSPAQDLTAVTKHPAMAITTVLHQDPDTSPLLTQYSAPRLEPAIATLEHDMSKLPFSNPLVESALQIISEESGIVISELTDDCVFADIGIDSLMSMVIGSRLREELDLDLDTDFSIFADLPTVISLKQFFSGYSSSSSSSTSGENDNASTPETSDDEDFPQVFRKDRVEVCRPTPSVILQGRPKTANKTIFMLPDGSGSASSYLTVPQIGDEVCMIGLNSPYLRDPENMNCTHTALMASFCDEIRRRQPVGPYYLGGWSSGGAFAFVCAETLMNVGQTVAGIVIIDAPVPQVMEHLPTSFYEYCNGLGLFGQDTPPPYLIPHFEATVDIMMPYKVKPLETAHMPKVGILWACDTVMDEKDAPKMKGMHFMVSKRTNFGPDGWETVLPGAEFVMDRVAGGNHFTLMVSFPQRGGSRSFFLSRLT